MMAQRAYGIAPLTRTLAAVLNPFASITLSR